MSMRTGGSVHKCAMGPNLEHRVTDKNEANLLFDAFHDRRIVFNSCTDSLGGFATGHDRRGCSPRRC